MKLAPEPSEVRCLVAQAFEDLGAVVFGPSALNETVLIDQGRYVARSYRVLGYMAMWLVKVGIVQFYDDEGHMLRTINLCLELEPQRLAA